MAKKNPSESAPTDPEPLQSPGPLPDLDDPKNQLEIEMLKEYIKELGPELSDALVEIPMVKQLIDQGEKQAQLLEEIRDYMKALVESEDSE